ncbi:hypothetical protein WDU94_006683 [Cyamophila willieti]
MARRGGRGGIKRFRGDVSPGDDDLETSNRYSILDDDNLGDDDYSSVNGSGKSAIPPIIIEGQLKNHKQVVAQLKQKLKEDFTVKLSRGGKSILRVKTGDDHRAATAYLDKQYQFHSFSLKEDYQPNWVLRGLPKSVTIEEIEDELKEKKLNVVKTKLISKDDNSTLELQLYPGKNNRTGVILQQ